jgi:hypothetical protein
MKLLPVNKSFTVFLSSTLTFCKKKRRHVAISNNTVVIDIIMTVYQFKYIFGRGGMKVYKGRWCVHNRVLVNYLPTPLLYSAMYIYVCMFFVYISFKLSIDLFYFEGDVWSFGH